ncbi:hypothetical protein FB451DRAFT_1178269 [Mycena latifolia]|nr:hypothetical protein FB451DRAFT_1178269 [Mycena latifolia]
MGAQRVCPEQMAEEKAWAKRLKLSSCSARTSLYTAVIAVGDPKKLTEIIWMCGTRGLEETDMRQHMDAPTVCEIGASLEYELELAEMYGFQKNQLISTYLISEHTVHDYNHYYLIFSRGYYATRIWADFNTTAARDEPHHLPNGHPYVWLEPHDPPQENKAGPGEVEELISQLLATGPRVPIRLTGKRNRYRAKRRRACPLLLYILLWATRRSLWRPFGCAVQENWRRLFIDIWMPRLFARLGLYPSTYKSSENSPKLVTAAAPK